MRYLLSRKNQGFCYCIKATLFHIFEYIKSIFMKKKNNRRKPALSSLINVIQKNVVTLFESGEKRDFQRLKDFITS